MVHHQLELKQESGIKENSVLQSARSLDDHFTLERRVSSYIRIWYRITLSVFLVMKISVSSLLRMRVQMQ